MGKHHLYFGGLFLFIWESKSSSIALATTLATA